MSHPFLPRPTPQTQRDGRSARPGSATGSSSRAASARSRPLSANVSAVSRGAAFVDQAQPVQDANFGNNVLFSRNATDVRQPLAVWRITDRPPSPSVSSIPEMPHVTMSHQRYEELYGGYQSLVMPQARTPRAVSSFQTHKEPELNRGLAENMRDSWVAG